jgi:hypothetical protein
MTVALNLVGIKFMLKTWTKFYASDSLGYIFNVRCVLRRGKLSLTRQLFQSHVSYRYLVLELQHEFESI